MIQNIHLKNFKSHKDTSVALGNLTLLCGQNGVGKSSVLQALLLLRQSFMQNRLDKVLSLRGSYCQVGTGKDALYVRGGSEEISFSIAVGEKTLDWLFSAAEDLGKDHLPTISQPLTEKDTLSSYSLFNSHFQYIGSGRITPPEEYLRDDYAVEYDGTLSKEYGKGEYTAHFLYRYQTNKVIELLRHPFSLDYQNNLIDQVTLWEREISQGVNVLPQKEGDRYIVEFSFNYSDGERTENFKGENVGFGLSYALPIIVAILSAQPSDLLLIENPEAHLHPYGQSKLAELMCLAAQAGIQIIVETHSDHIVNGVLVQTKQFEQKQKGVSREKVKIYQFRRNDNEHAAEAIEVEILPKGRIRKPPVGFFDQIGIDLRALM